MYFVNYQAFSSKDIGSLLQNGRKEEQFLATSLLGRVAVIMLPFFFVMISC
jgi:hypothetical protein